MVCAAAFNSVFFLYVPDNTGQNKLPADTLESYLSAALQILVNPEYKDNCSYQSESKISSIHLRLVKGQKRDSQDLFPSRSLLAECAPKVYREGLIPALFIYPNLICH